MSDPHRSVPARIRGRLNDPQARQTLLFALAAVVVGVTLFLPRPQNFAPVGALGLFAGAHARVRRAWLVPLGALAVHTVATGGYAWVVLTSVYLGFGLYGWIGVRWLRDRARPRRVGAAALAASAAFFLVSNVGTWITFGTARGESLLQHYLLGVPLFWNTLLGDLFFSAALFGGFAVASARTTTPVGQGALP